MGLFIVNIHGDIEGDYEVIKQISSADVRENIHGEWIVDERPESNREIICSNCEQPIFKYHKLDFDYRPNFCPNCGASMKGDN